MTRKPSPSKKARSKALPAKAKAVSAAGRPSTYSEAIVEHICAELINGRSLRQICIDEGMPVRWLERYDDFAAKYARARELQADFMDDKILELADNCTAATARADRVKLAAYQWRASKLKPKKYGDKVELEHGCTVGVKFIIEG
ncbi:MAG: hypothetical protein WDN46_10265 [Methylocella sp.]